MPVADHAESVPGVEARRYRVEDYVREQVGQFAADIDAAIEIERARAGALTRARANAGALEREVAKSVTDQALDEETPAGVYLAARRDLTKQQDEKAAALKEARKADARPSRDIARIMQSWDTFPPDRMREALRHLIREVRVARTGVRTPADIWVIWVWDPIEE